MKSSDLALLPAAIRNLMPDAIKVKPARAKRGTGAKSQAKAKAAAIIRERCRGPVTLVLPVPPGVNKLYMQRRDGGRYLNPKAAAFKSTLAAVAAEMRVIPFVGVVWVTLTAWNTGFDVDALNKIVLDGLQGPVIGNDRQVKKLTAEVRRDEGERRMVVVVTAAAE